jgi:His/Glu/Gln/Arg/opine family amino acid ABC transporter permease subunit
MLVEYLPSIWQGFWTTIWLTLAILFLSTPIALLLALARGTRYGLVVAVYVNFIRAMPALILLYFTFYALPRFGLTLSPVQAALIGLTAVSAAYLSEDIRGGLQAVPEGQILAGAALGLPFWWFVRRILLPQAIPIILPNYVTSAMLTVQGTSLASLVAVTELSAATYRAISITQDAFGFLLISATLYLALNALCRLFQVYVQRRTSVWHSGVVGR